ncbi:uncharacterized protein PV09_00575 [Verruconis gallopava]|uniref:Nucleolar complex protein 2 n=1 Tax=Verruconis gallopava TaxID=253628 RepID=A0A0D2APK5_9PEZI|nr:uncharacterized protein PV09_00575 [Verruconis gallopava]KIW08618.1 hypothetical protein PV09_00575 [Verruconis gallopava]
MAQTKATKKFEKRHLKETLQRRKEVAKIKQKKQIKEKQKARRAKEKEGEEAEKPEKRINDINGEKFKEMTVDEFFQGGFEIPEQLSEKRTTKSKNAPTTGKRKRTSATDDNDDEDDNDSDSSSTDSVESFPVAYSSASDDESEADIGDHKQQLEDLKKKDPEFYEYMKENDPELLDFEDADLAEIDLLSDDEDTPKKKRKTAKGSASDSEDENEPSNSEVTKAMINKWEKAMVETKSLRALREVVLAFRAAAHLNEETGKSYKYRVSNPDVYHSLLMIALKHAPTVLHHHLPVKEHANGKVSLPTDSKKFRTMAPMLKSHITSVHHLLQGLSDSATLRLTLSSILPLLPYILSFKPVVRNLIKTITATWSSTTSDEATRISAFLVLRRLMVIGDAGLREAVLKSVYQGLVRGSRNTTPHTIAGVNLMKNSAAELWGLDSKIGYTTGFTFIRQLAIHLRSTITNPTSDSYKTIYNWQYVHSLDFWSRVLSEHCASIKEAESGKESPLRPLIYPTVQITIGAMRLIPTSQYFPLRFQLMHSLLRLSRATTTYIPLGPALYEVLQSNELRKPPKQSTLRPLDFKTNIRAPKQYLKTRVYQDGLGEQVCEFLSEFLVLWCRNIAFPELALPLIVIIKRWLRDAGGDRSGNRNHKLNSALKLVLQKIESNSRFIEEKRAKVEFAPGNRAGIEGFLKDTEWEKTPLGAFVVGQRKVREQKEKVLEEGRKAQEAKRAKLDEESDDENVRGGGGFVDAEEQDESEGEGEEDEEQ